MCLLPAVLDSGMLDESRHLAGSILERGAAKVDLVMARSTDTRAFVLEVVAELATKGGRRLVPITQTTSAASEGDLGVALC